MTFYSNKQIRRAGEALIDPNASEAARVEAERVIGEWRAAHALPLTGFKNALRARARIVEPDVTVSHRLKRMESIAGKLRNHPMNLSQMQDIAGCRAIVEKREHVYAVHQRLKGVRHELIDMDDYIERPRRTGYRSLHLMYRFESQEPVHAGRRIEVQIRSRPQHAWATAVEIVGTVLSQPLKAGEGHEDWLRFFALASTLISSVEGGGAVPDTPADFHEAASEMRVLWERLRVADKLEGYAGAIYFELPRPAQDAAFFVIKLFPLGKRLYVHPFTVQEAVEASEFYFEAEHQMARVPGGQAVLVSVDDVAALEVAYPNFYLDTQLFLGMLEGLMGFPQPDEPGFIPA